MYTPIKNGQGERQTIIFNEKLDQIISINVFKDSQNIITVYE